MTDLGALQRLSHSDVDCRGPDRGHLSNRGWRHLLVMGLPSWRKGLYWRPWHHHRHIGNYSHKTILGGTFFEDFVFLFNTYLLIEEVNWRSRPQVLSIVQLLVKLQFAYKYSFLKPFRNARSLAIFLYSWRMTLDHFITSTKPGIGAPKTINEWGDMAQLAKMCQKVGTSFSRPCLAHPYSIPCGQVSLDWLIGWSQAYPLIHRHPNPPILV
jgi:hypothetical protein